MVMTFQSFGPWIYGQEWVVAKLLGPQESIQDKINEITDAGSTRRYKIEVLPGVYQEDITMKAYVDVVCVGGMAVIQPESGDTFGVTMASNSMLQGFQIDMTNGATTGIVIGALTNVIVEDCWVTNGGAGDIAISDASTGTSVILRKCRIDSAWVGYRKTGTGTTWLADCRITSTLALIAVQAVVADDGGVQTTETTEANDATANDMTLLPASPAINDAYYFGGLHRFQQLSLNVGTAGVKAPGDWTLTWEYYNGSAWTTLTVTDNTSEFTVAGTNTVTFTPPVDWATVAVNALTAYWIRARVSAATLPIGTMPVGTQAWVTDAIDIDVDAGILNLLDNELMFAGTGANVDVAAADITVNSYSNTLAGDGWRIGDDATAEVFSHDDRFNRVEHAGAGFMVAFEEPQVYVVFNGMKIGDALTNITDAGDAYRYTIKVNSGEYSESVTMKQYVDLVGVSNQSVVITQAATNVITAAANSRIKSVRIEITAASSNYGIYCNNVYAYIEDVIVLVTHSAGANYAVGSAGTGGFEIHDSVLEIDNVASFPVEVNGSGTHLVYDSELVNTGAGGYGVVVRAGFSLSSFNNKLRSDEGFSLIADASTQVLSYGDDFTTVVFSGATGLFADLTDARLYTCGAGVAVGEWVYASANDTVTEADADALATMPTIGRVVYKPTATTCYVKNHGYAYDAAANAGFGDAWVAGEEFWVSSTAGQITTTMHPVWPQRAGVAVSTQRFKILIGDNLGLAHTNTFSATAGEAVEEWVYISAADTVDEADASAAATMNAVGMIVEKPDATTAVVKYDGKVLTTGKGWAANDPVYISDTTPGDIVNVPPVMGVIQRVGTVVHDAGLAVASGLLIELM